VFLLDASAPGADQDLIITASDVVTAVRCEYQVLRICDEKLGRTPVATFETDEMLQRAARLGDRHEAQVLAGLKRHHREVVEIPAAPRPYTREGLHRAHQQTIAAMGDGADVVFQGSFFDGTFHGRSDFLVRDRLGGYAVWDSKLARRAKTEALLQLAAYADQVQAAGIEVASRATLVLGDGSRPEFDLAELLPVYTERRDRLLTLLSDHRSQPAPVAWGDEDYLVCGRCDYCAEQVAEHRDVLGVHRVSLPRRRRLRAQGIYTIEDLAEAPAEEGTVAAGLRDQARMQAGRQDVDGSVDLDGRRMSYRVLSGHTLGTLPEPNPGDVFFDFEGDPLWQDEHGEWGLEYLFGVLEAADGGQPGAYRQFLAHTRAEEGQALVAFLEYLRRRREQFPQMHVYHYANYEKAALRRLSLQHVVGEEAVDELLREGVLVDLYEVVQGSLRLSERSYGLKVLEPLYMGNQLRSGEITDGGASVTAYANYCLARDLGRSGEAEEILTSIVDYNHYDCRSTLGLRNWLLERAAERSVPLGQQQPAEPEELREVEALPQEQVIVDHVQALARAAAERGDEPDDDVRALGMVAAAVSYHRREDKQYWWGHFDRLNTAVADWSHTRDVFVVESAEVTGDWSLAEGGRRPRRTLRLRGQLAEGSLLRAGSQLYAMYHRPFPEGLVEPDDGRNLRGGHFGIEVLAVHFGTEASELVVSERLGQHTAPYSAAPMALTPPAPVNTKSLKESLAQAATSVAEGLPAIADHPAIDLLRRRPPRLATPGPLPAVTGADYLTAITTATRQLDDSYLAVQGPPGSGKTWIGARVIANLVAEGWKIGVVGQSHAVVENVLNGAIAAGVRPELAAKKPGRSAERVRWGGTTATDVSNLLAAPGGALIGGTAWTMTGRAVPPGSLDLLVIDEAGQFSLANTLAVARATRRLLLLGDPQQLPQVSQGSHPEPVDTSALSWLSGGDPVLSSELGYFLALTWRMHPDLCEAVSQLSYNGALHAAPAATDRHLDGPPPGVECRFVAHRGNTTCSTEEAEEVLAQVRRHLGARWHDPGAGPTARPLGQQDILVVAPYNAQVQTITELLAAEGLPEVRVGTVDRFQGQQAPVVIVSATVSAVQESPRGMEFVLNRNRMNVAISRGQWRAVLIRSPHLTDVLPHRPELLADLGAFIALCQPQSARCTPSA